MSHVNFITLNIAIILDENNKPITVVGAVITDNASPSVQDLAAKLSEMNRYFCQVLLWSADLHTEIKDYQEFAKMTARLNELVQQYAAEEDRTIKPFADFLDNLDLSNLDGEQ